MTPPATGDGERGVALALAIVVLVIGGALAAAMFFVAFEEARLSENAGRLIQSFGVAEEGALEAIRAWEPKVYNVHDPYPLDSETVPGGFPSHWIAAPHGTGTYGGRVYKLNGELYFIDMAGRDRRSDADSGTGIRQHVGVLVHVRPIVPGVTAALTVGKGIRGAGSITSSGDDQPPPGWGPCGPRDSATTGLRIDSNPPGPSHVAVGGLSYSQLADLATRTLPGGSHLAAVAPAVVKGRCDETVATNWGDGSHPDHACGGYVPVLHILGDANIGGGEGQGILLVDGDLVLQGDFLWHGLIMVGGSMRVTGSVTSDVEVWGAALVADSVLLNPALGGSLAVTYSKCAIIRVLESVASVAVLPRRGWIEAYEVP